MLSRTPNTKRCLESAFDDPVESASSNAQEVKRMNLDENAANQNSRFGNFNYKLFENAYFN
jgi:hypothetical protein